MGWKQNLLGVLGFGLLLSAGPLAAAPVNGNGMVTPDVIFGSGNANGSFTGTTVADMEIALRAKLRFDVNGDPQNIFNYDGDHTYTFDPALSNAPAGLSIFNFEFSINSDPTGGLGRNLGELDFLLSIDVDPGPGVTNVILGDPIDVDLTIFVPDHSFGNNSTANGAGEEAGLTPYDDLRSGNNVVQNSINLGFFPATLFPDPGAPGQYSVTLSAETESGDFASTTIDIVVAAATVPEPGTLWLVGSMVALLGFSMRGSKRV